MALFQWAAAASASGTWPELAYLHSTLNGVRLPMGLAAKAKAAGMKAGPADIYLDVRRGGWSGLRIELKRPANKAAGVTKGRPSKEQREWQGHYTENGFRAAICYGADEARQVIEQYLGGA